MVRTLHSNKKPENTRDFPPAYFFSASTLGLAEYLGSLRQLLAPEGKTYGCPPPAQSRYLVYTQGSPSDALNPLIEKDPVKGAGQEPDRVASQAQGTVSAGSSLDR